jgi:hypothetical protein
VDADDPRDRRRLDFDRRSGETTLAQGFVVTLAARVRPAFGTRA